MRCTNCNSEWSVGQGGSQTLKCPFCGVMLNVNKKSVMIMNEVVKEIIDRNGENILLDKARFSAMFSDIAYPSNPRIFQQPNHSCIIKFKQHHGPN
jgi:hypothetical protein